MVRERVEGMLDSRWPGRFNRDRGINKKNTMKTTERARDGEMGICVPREYRVGGYECMSEGGWCWFFCVTERESE